MPTTTENDESELLDAFAQGQLHSYATKGELAKFRAAAHATALTYRSTQMTVRWQPTGCRDSDVCIDQVRGQDGER